MQTLPLVASAEPRNPTLELRRLYLAHVSVLVAYGRRLGADRETVLDAIHDVFVACHQRLEAGLELEHPRAYLLRALRHQLLRQHRRPEVATDEPDLHSPLLHNDTWLANTERQERIQQVGQALRQLPDREREALTLRYLAGLEPETVAEVMGLQRQSVYNLLHRALTRLQPLLRATLGLLAVWLGHA